MVNRKFYYVCYRLHPTTKYILEVGYVTAFIYSLSQEHVHFAYYYALNVEVTLQTLVRARAPSTYTYHLIIII